MKDDGRGRRIRTSRLLPILLVGVAGAAVPFAIPGGPRLCDYVGECAPSPRDVGSGDCVEIDAVGQEVAKLDEITDCTESQPAVVVAVGTLGDRAADNARSLGANAFCRESGAPWLSALPKATAVELRIATDGSDPLSPQGGDTYACIVTRADGQDFTDEFQSVRPR